MRSINTHPQRGNVLFIILIVIVMTAALFAAVSQSFSVKEDSGAAERAKLDGAVTNNCTVNVDNAIDRLKLVNGCTSAQISYELPGGGNVNAQAPADKRCHLFHPSGAGISPCGTYTTVTAGADVTPDPVNWASINPDPCSDGSSAATISGIDTAIQLQVSNPNSIQGLLNVQINGGSITNIPDNGTLSLTVSSGDIVTFILGFPVNSAASGTMSVTNVSDSNSVLDTFSILTECF